MIIAIPLTQQHIDDGKQNSNLHCAFARAVNAHPNCKNASVQYEPFNITKSGIWSSGELSVTLKDKNKRIAFHLYHDACDFMFSFNKNKRWCNDGMLYLTDEYEKNWLIYEENTTNEPIPPYNPNN